MPRGGAARPSPAPRSSRSAALLLVLAALLLGATQLLLLPPWMGEDEPWHFEYASHVADGHLPVLRGVDLRAEHLAELPASPLQVRRRFPDLSEEAILARQGEILAAMTRSGFRERVDWSQRAAAPRTFDWLAQGITATVQPPLYYLALGAWLAPFRSLPLEARLHLARVPSLVLFAGAVLLAWRFALLAFEGTRLGAPAAALAAGFALFLPMHVNQAATVNDDVLARFLVAVVLVLAARQARGRAGRREAAALLLLACLAPLAKTTAVGALPVAACGVCLRPGAGGARGRRRTLALAGLALLALVAVIALFWLAGSPALPRQMEGLLARVRGSATEARLRGFWLTFVGTTGWESRQLPGAVYLGAAAAVLLGLVASGAALARRGLAHRRVLLLALVAVLVQVGLVALRGEARGRYAMPVLPALAALVAAGWLGPAPPRVRRPAAGALLAVLSAACGLFLWAFLALHAHGRLGS